MNLDDLGNFDNLEDLNKILQERVKQHNQAAQQDFEGLSPEQMHRLQVNFPDDNSPLRLNNLPDADLNKCPMLNQVCFLMDRMKNGQTIKLTQTGALNTKLVKELYAQGFLKNELIERGISKLFKESDAPEIELTTILITLSGLAKRRRQKLSLTKMGEKHGDDKNFILRKLLYPLFYKFNWAYFDRYMSEDIGRVNAGFSLYLLKKFGDKKRDSRFYAERYFKALPMLTTGESEDSRAYTVRTFNRYFSYFGFVETHQKEILDPTYVKKTGFLDKLISVT